MCLIQLTEKWIQKQLESAAAVYLGPKGGSVMTPLELAQTRRVARSTIYRQAGWLRQQIHLAQQFKTKMPPLEAENCALRECITQLETQLVPYKGGHWVQVTDERLALTTLELTARSDSVSDVQAALKVAFSLAKPPSEGTIAAIIERGAQLAEAILDRAPKPVPLDVLEFDELFHADHPLLVVLEPKSMAVYLLESLDSYTANTWKFAFDYREVPISTLLAHDCSSQGNLLARLFGVDSQLCLFHRLREIKRELATPLDALYKQALRTCDEPLWDAAVTLEKKLSVLAALTWPLDLFFRTCRRFEDTLAQFLYELSEAVDLLDRLAELWGHPLKIPSLRGWHLRAPQFLNHLKLWDKLAEQVQFTTHTTSLDGYAMLDALAAVHLGINALETAFLSGDETLYWQEQARFLADCTRLRQVQSCCENSAFIAQKLAEMMNCVTRTTSLVEALNRRLRAFTDAKRHVTERQLRLMHLHHNTTPFSRDAKRAGKSPWQWLDIELDGLDDGFVGVLRAQNDGRPWPSSWAFKS